MDYQVLIATPGCNVGDIITANGDGSVTSTDGTVTYQPTSENFAVNFGVYEKSATWVPIAKQTVYAFAWNLDRPPVLSVVAMPYDPNATAFNVLQQANMIFPDELSATTALQAVLAALPTLTNETAKTVITPLETPPVT